VESMAIRAPCHQGRIAQLLDLPVVAFIIGLRGNQEDLIPFHHLLVGMAFLADLRMKLLSRSDDFWLVAFQDGNLVEAVAIGAGGRIGITSEDRFTVDAIGESIIGMAGCADLNHPDFISFPRSQFMDILVAVLALDVVQEMGARVMLCPLPLMASMTGNRFGLNLGSFCLEMFFNIHDIPVAAIAGKGSMDGLGKLSLADLLAVTAKAFRIVNAFIAVFSTFNGDLLSPFFGFGRFGNLSRIRILLRRLRFRCPEEVVPHH